MALGFKDCCNENFYFLLTGIPATVSEFETYYIQTTHGENFCAEYLEIPTLNYQPPIYNILELTQLDNCQSCLALHSCPTEETFISNQFGAGSVVATDSCAISTVQPMQVECQSVNPTFSNTSDGIVQILVFGGTPPYRFYNQNNNQQIGQNSVPDDGLYTLITNAPEGTYVIRVEDDNSDFVETLTCILDAVPAPLISTCNPTGVSFFGENDGSITITIDGGGIPPYSLSFNGTVLNNLTQGFSTTFDGLTSGNYTVTVSDSGVGGDFQTIDVTCFVTTPAQVIYPNELCLSIPVCNQVLRLNFDRISPDYNLRAQYQCMNPQDAGLTAFTLRWENQQGWRTTNSNWNGTLNLLEPCGTAYVNNDPTFFRNPQINGILLGTLQGFGSTWATTIATLSSPACPPIAKVLSTTDYCPNAYNGTMTALASAGGDGPPYSFRITNTANGNFTIQDSNAVFNGLTNGNYTLVVTDGAGNQSTPVSFTINTVTPPTINATNYTIQNVPGFPSTGTAPNPRIYTNVNVTFDCNSVPVGASFSGKIRLIRRIGIKVDENGGTPDSLASEFLYETNLTNSTITKNGVTENLTFNLVSTNPTTDWSLLGNCDGPYTVGNLYSCFQKCGCGVTPCTDAESSPWCNCSIGTPPGTANEWYQKDFYYDANFTMGEGDNSVSLTHSHDLTIVRGFPPPECYRYLKQDIFYSIIETQRITGCVNVNPSLNVGTKSFSNYIQIKKSYQIAGQLSTSFSNSQLTG